MTAVGAWLKLSLGLIVVGLLLGITGVPFFETVATVLLMVGVTLLGAGILLAVALALKGLLFGRAIERGRRFN